MVNRVCISINNRCNLNCKYCHFHEKKGSIKIDEMDIVAILDNIMEYIDNNGIDVFKIGFIGNGEPLYCSIFHHKWITRGRIQIAVL